MREYETADLPSSTPLGFECPTCEHFPLRVNKLKTDLVYCPRCNRDMMLVESLFDGCRAVWENKKGKILDCPISAFERVPGKPRSRGRRVF